MQLAIVAAGFSPGEADQLRRAMAAWRRRGSLGPFEDRLICGMAERGYSESFARQIFHQIQGFGEYGFPESHSASFALLVYVSSWLKRHEPAAFTCALINSQPMGFYAPSQLVQDARRHGVEVRPVDVCCSDYDCTLEPTFQAQPAIRLGLRLVKGLSGESARRIVAARRLAAFVGTQDLVERTGIGRRDLNALAAADSLRGLAGHRHHARWEVLGVEPPTPLLPQPRIAEAAPMLRAASEGEDIASDYNHLGLTLRRHPMALLRKFLQEQGMYTAQDLRAFPDGAQVLTTGVVITKQRPGSAKGVTFVTLEDETGHVNVIVWRKLAERQRKTLLGARLMGVSGRLQREGDVLHLVARQLDDYTHLLGTLMTRSRDFH
jgi:error-prone DNA polymerase